MVFTLGALATFLAEAAAAAQEREEPPSCRVGAYVTALHDFDANADTFQADLWIWSVCPNPDLRPLESMEFVNANAVSTLLTQSQPRGDLTWSSIKVSGTFRHDWNEQDFPFDPQRLLIVMEAAADDASEFVYEADEADSGYNTAIQMAGWEITRFTLTDSVATYQTTFGDPALPAGGTSAYSRLTLGIDIARAGPRGFFRLTVVVYVAFFLSLITYVMYLETSTTLGAQMGLLAGALFASAVNMLNASAALSAPGVLTLVDQVHIVVLFYIVIATVFAVGSRLLEERGWTREQVVRLNYRACAVAAVSFVLINVALVAIAAGAD